jgi:hypothetical protein
VAANWYDSIGAEPIKRLSRFPLFAHSATGPRSIQ